VWGGAGYMEQVKESEYGRNMISCVKMEK
jgi:hypothetical protein